MKKNKSKGYEYTLVMVMFVVIFGCFAAALSTINPRSEKASVNPVSAFDINLEDGYEFVEADGKNGIKYYFITKSSHTDNDAASSSSTAAVTTTEDSTGSTNETSVKKSTKSTTKSSTKTSTKVSTKSETATTTTATKAEQKDSQKVAYLTFDDGPSENTEKILDILDRYNVKATFFVIYHKNMESKYKEIADRGHTVALHSYTHNYKKVYASEKAFFDDLSKIHDYVYSVTGVDSKIIRFPGGSSNTISNKYCKGIMKNLKKDVLERGYIYHDWNVDSTDAKGNNRDPEVLLNNVKSGLGSKKNVNILMHDTGKSKQTTVQALPSIIEYVRSQGYEMERITEDSKVIKHG